MDRISVNRFSFRRKGSNRKKEEDVTKDYDYSKLSYLRSVYIIILICSYCFFQRAHVPWRSTLFFTSTWLVYICLTSSGKLNIPFIIIWSVVFKNYTSHEVYAIFHSNMIDWLLFNVQRQLFHTYAGQKHSLTVQ